MGRLLHRQTAVSITDASESPETEFRRRRFRYLSMMLLRLVCLILAAVVVGADVPYAGLWAAICIAGMVLLPWAAVLIANDRLPPAKHTRSAAPAHQPPSLPSQERREI